MYKGFLVHNAEKKWIRGGFTLNFDSNYDFDYDYDRREQRERVFKVILKILIWLVILAGVVLGAWAVTEYCIEITYMTGYSMNGALEDGDRIIINRMSYKNSDPERFDIIVFEKNGKEHSYYGIRRVIGLPGETVCIREGQIYINDELLEEPVNVEPMLVPGLAEEPLLLDEDEFFVLGDNRNESEDSRFTSMGNVTREEIVGRAWIRTNSFGFIGNFNKK